MTDESDLEEIPDLTASPSPDDQFGEHSPVMHGAGGDGRRAHHNALERKRRDHIKDSYSSLREVVPTLKGEKASRALILKRSAEYIQTMKSRISDHQKDIAELKRQNATLEKQIRMIETNTDVPKVSSEANVHASASLPVSASTESGELDTKRVRLSAGTDDLRS